jgi:hypothetical protein
MAADRYRTSLRSNPILLGGSPQHWISTAYSVGGTAMKGLRGLYDSKSYGKSTKPIDIPAQQAFSTY